MTAEIAILNKSAVALAADSAVTVGHPRQPKIFNTVNKVFMLSKRQPVGVMLYGSAQILGVPWETIVKLYRVKLGRKTFAHLEEYSADFLRFLSRKRALFPAAEQAKYFASLALAFYVCVREDIDNHVQREIEKKGKVSISDVRRIVRTQIQAHFEVLQRCDALRGFTQRFTSRLLAKNSATLTKLRNRIFQKLPLSRTDKAKIRTMTGWFFSRDTFGLIPGTSGLVIAGFGEKDIYPRLVEFVVAGVIDGKLKFGARRHTQIGRDCSANMIPFGQTEVVRSFMDGIDPGMQRVLDRFLNKVFGNYPAVLLNSIPGLTVAAKATAAKKVSAASRDILKKFQEEFNDFRQKTLIDPIVSTVAVLPKDELAAMAEALVNLTSFRRRFSRDAETVGGPIDVAVLSKGDGFIWVKRKQYFKPELNPHFSTA